MTRTGQLTRRVRFRQRELDANGERLGALADIATCHARVQALRGGEAVQQQRLQGNQPVIITVRASAVTRAIDNAYAAVDARAPTIAWDIQSVIDTEDRAWREILAVQRKGEAT